MRTPGRVLVNLLTGDGGDEFEELWGNGVSDVIVILVFGGGGSVWQVNFADRRDEGDDLDAEDLLKVFLCDGTGSNTA